MKPVKPIKPYGPPPGKYVPGLWTDIRKTLKAAAKRIEDATLPSDAAKEQQ